MGGGGGEAGGYGGGGRGRLYTHGYMGSDESHFNVLLIARNKVTGQCPQTTHFEEKGEPKRIPAEVPLLTSLTPYCSRPNRLTRLPPEG